MCVIHATADHANGGSDIDCAVYVDHGALWQREKKHEQTCNTVMGWQPGGRAGERGSYLLAGRSQQLAILAEGQDAQGSVVAQGHADLARLDLDHLDLASNGTREGQMACRDAQNAGIVGRHVLVQQPALAQAVDLDMILQGHEDPFGPDLDGMNGGLGRDVSAA